MALTATLIKTDVFGSKRFVWAYVAFDSSYPTGGETITPQTIGLGNIEFCLVEPASGYIIEYINSTGKLLVYTPVGALSAHTHAVLLDAGASGAEAAHTHAVALDGGASGAEAAHTHAVALDGGASGAGDTHTHTATMGGDTAAGTSHTHSPTTKTILHYEQGLNIQGSANTNAENADAASEPTNGAVVAAYATVAAGAWTHGAITNPGLGRNLCVTIKNDTGGALNLYEGVMTFTLTGTWRGGSQVETVTFTSSAGNKAIAAAQWRYKYGIKPFDTLTDFTLDNMPDNNLKIAGGIGSKLGCLNDLATPAEADIIRWRKNGTVTAVTGLVDTTNMTVNMDTLADNDDYELWYKSVSYMSAIAAEAAHTHAATGLTCTPGNEATHTHGPGTLADAASGAGASHTHGAGSLADAASAAGSSHTHGAGTLADTASGSGGAITAAAGTEVANTTDLSALTDVRLFAIGT